jgi:hypothetical protein
MTLKALLLGHGSLRVARRTTIWTSPGPTACHHIIADLAIAEVVGVSAPMLTITSAARAAKSLYETIKHYPMWQTMRRESHESL